MDDVKKARRKWKQAEEAVEGAQARLRAATGNPVTDSGALAQARRELADADDEERKAKRKYRKLKSESGD